MQTLIDPYELALSPAPVSAIRVVEQLAEVVEVEVEVAEMASAKDDRASAPLPPSPDSSGRLRCWCSED